MASTLQHTRHMALDWARYACAGLAALLMHTAVQAQTLPAMADTNATPSGPIRLRTPDTVAAPNALRVGTGATTAVERMPTRPPLAPKTPSDFEVYVRGLAGDKPISRYGSELLTSLYDPADESLHTPLVPPDYLLRTGDELVVTLWGSVDADLRTQIDRTGRITIPRVGPIMLSGVRYADASEVISRRVAQTFKNFNISVSLGQLRGVRVYVTGFVQQPGAMTTSALATLTQVLMQAGGPSNAGSFRQIQLRRGGQQVGQFDLYELLLNGNRGADLLLQADDVVHVGPVGRQVALVGSVNRPAIFELKPGETLADLLRMAGGFNPVADSTRLSLDRFSDRSSGRTLQLDLPAAQRNEPQNGDVLRAFNAAEVAMPSEQQNKRVRIEGEVARPGEYILPPSSSLADAIAAAGGFTSQAYVYGTTFTRESVRKTQQENFDRALRDMEVQLTTRSASRRTSSAEEATAAESSTLATSRFIEQLRKLKPTGRVVLQLEAQARALPELVLEDGDRLLVPAKQTSVGVFGSVFNAGSFLYSNNRTLDSYLQLAGGPTRGADRSSLFVVRANGSVISAQQKPSSLFSSEDRIYKMAVEPGDTIFVPEEMDKSTFTQKAKEWTQILYQFGLGAAALQTIRN